MALETSDVLYLSNATTVDSAAGIDIRLLTATGGASNEAQSVRIAVGTGGNNGQERTFDPASTLVTASANATSFQGEGYALRLTEDMTPADDTNCNAMLNSGTLAVMMRVRLNATGGTNLGGANTITMRASLWRYNPTTDTGVSIASGSATQTWNTSALGAENNTLKNTTVNINVSSNVEFQQGEILLLQVGIQGTTLVAPTLNTTNYDLSLEIGATTSTNIDFATDQYISQVCFLTGSASGSGTATGAGVPVYPTTGTATGSGTATGVLEADKETTGTATGVGTATGAFGAVKLGTGTATGVGTVTGATSIVKPTVGTVNVNEGGTEIVETPAAYTLLDNGQLAKLAAEISPYPLYQRL